MNPTSCATSRLTSLTACLAVACLAAVVFASAAGSATTAVNYRTYVAPDSVCPTDRADASASEQRKAMACLVNYARRRQGLKPLVIEPRLSQAARLKAADISRCRQFDHGACGKEWDAVFKASGYWNPRMSVLIGENLAWGESGFATPREVMLGWLNSPDHRDNLLEPRFRQMGLAVAQVAELEGVSNVVLWTQAFGARWR